MWDDSIDLNINPCEGCGDWDELLGCISKGACADVQISVKENEMKMPWEQDRDWNNLVTTNATESRFNQIVQKDQATLIADLINRVASLENTVELILEQLQMNTVENTNEIQSRPTAEFLVRPTATSSTDVPWWIGE